MATSTYEASYKKYFGDRFDNITKNSSDEEVRNLYDKWAADYDKVSIISLSYNHDKNSWDNCLTFLAPPPSGEVKRIGRYCIKVALCFFFFLVLSLGHDFAEHKLNCTIMMTVFYMIHSGNIESRLELQQASGRMLGRRCKASLS